MVQVHYEDRGVEPLWDRTYAAWQPQSAPKQCLQRTQTRHGVQTMQVVEEAQRHASVHCDQPAGLLHSGGCVISKRCEEVGKPLSLALVGGISVSCVGEVRADASGSGLPFAL
jgi:hypothetical protein